jgi:anti-sigma-K factor RskA
MNCDERQEQFLLEAFGGLEAADSQALRSHLASGCTSCAAAAAEASAIAAQFALTLPPETPHPDVLNRLISKVRASAKRDEPPMRPAFRWLPALSLSAVAAVLAAAITAGIMWSQLRDARLLKTPGLRYVSLAGSTPQPGARGRIFWDADHGFWHVYVFDLAPPPSGKTYELWFIGNDGRKTPAGTFDVNGNGNAHLVVKVPADLGPLAAAAVTDENAGGAPQPTGSIQLVGKIE